MDKLIADKLKEAQEIKDDNELSYEEKRSKISTIFESVLEGIGSKFDIDKFLKKKRKAGGASNYASKTFSKRNKVKKEQRAARKNNR